MNPHEVPSGDGVRERVLVEVDQLRAHYLNAKQAGVSLNWLRREYWIDHERWLVMPLDTARYLGIDSLTTVPDAQYEYIELGGCRKSPLTVSEVIHLLAVFVLGNREHPRGVSDFINFAVVQPLLNPPFEPLFWLGLASQMEANRSEANLGEALGAMAFDLSRFPESRSEAPDVRRAQVAWVNKEYEPDLDVATWVRASEADWTAHCQELLHARRTKVDGVFFETSHAAIRMLTDPDNG